MTGIIPVIYMMLESKAPTYEQAYVNLDLLTPESFIHIKLYLIDVR